MKVFGFIIYKYPPLSAVDASGMAVEVVPSS